MLIYHGVGVAGVDMAFRLLAERVLYTQAHRSCLRRVVYISQAALPGTYFPVEVI
jgi:hypothetical protein